MSMTLLEARGALAPDYQMRDPENKRLEEAGGVILWIGHAVFPVVDASGQEVMNLLSADPGHSDAAQGEPSGKVGTDKLGMRGVGVGWRRGPGVT